MFLYIDISSVSYVIPLIAGVAVGIGSWVYVRYRKAKSKISKMLGIDENAGKEVEGDVALRGASDAGTEDMYLGDGGGIFDEDIVITDVEAGVVPMSKRAKNSYGIKFFADGKYSVLNLILKGDKLPCAEKTDGLIELAYSPSDGKVQSAVVTVVKSGEKKRVISFSESLVYSDIEFDVGDTSLLCGDALSVEMGSDSESGEFVILRDANGRFEMKKEIKWKLKGYLSDK